MGKTETQLKTQYKNIPAIIKKIFDIKKEERTFDKVAELFNNEQTNIVYSKLSVWYKKEQTSFIFNHNTNTELNNDIIGISLRTIIGNKNLIIPVVSYLFYMVEMLANGDPFILAIDNAWKIVDNQYIAPIFFKLLQELPGKNAIVVATTDGDSKLSESTINEPIVDYFATEIYMGNPKISSYQKRVFALQEEESRILSLMKVEDRNFLLKCINDIVISSINLKDFNYYKNIFSNDNVSINAMKKAKETAKSNEPEQWIPIFLQLLEEYEKAVRQKKMRENEMNQIKWEEARSDENNRNRILSGN